MTVTHAFASSEGREVWCHNLGPADQVAEELARWLAANGYGRQ